MAGYWKIDIYTDMFCKGEPAQLQRNVCGMYEYNSEAVVGTCTRKWYLLLYICTSSVLHLCQLQCTNGVGVTCIPYYKIHVFAYVVRWLLRA